MTHRCRRCNGSGLVCPECRGDRIVRTSEWNVASPHVKIARCDSCCEGNNINPDKEQRAIAAYVSQEQRAHVKRQMSLVEGDRAQ